MREKDGKKWLQRLAGVPNHVRTWSQNYKDGTCPYKFKYVKTFQNIYKQAIKGTDMELQVDQANLLKKEEEAAAAAIADPYHSIDELAKSTLEEIDDVNSTEYDVWDKFTESCAELYDEFNEHLDEKDLRMALTAIWKEIKQGINDGGRGMKRSLEENSQE